VAAATLRLVQTIPLVGVEGRIDHMAIDVSGQRLFIAAIGNNTVEIVDLRAGKRIHSISGFHEPQGVAWIPERGQLFVASGGDDTCHALDGSSFGPTPVGGKIEDADNVRYDGAAHRVYVGCGNGALRAFDATNWSVVGESILPAHPESFQTESRGPRVFANVPGVRSVEVIDRADGRVAGSWPLGNVGGNFPMALDEEHHRLFIGCRKPPTLVVLDSNSGKELAKTSIDGDADDIFHDAKRNRIYVSCGAGFVDVIEVGTYKLLERVSTASGARTSLFVPELNRLYLAVPHRGNQPSEVRVNEPSND
jgi:DNA-binding beta-propeller fold protein YncE